MKKILKKEVIIAFIIGVLISSGITVYATGYLASQVTYKDGKTVEQALNDLYKKNNGSEFDNKNYIQTGLSIYQDRVTILSGGYYVDENNVTYVNIKLKTNMNFKSYNFWLLIYGLPASNKTKCITDTENNYMFRIGDFASMTGRIDVTLDYYATEIPKDTEFTLQYKY